MAKAAGTCFKILHRMLINANSGNSRLRYSRKLQRLAATLGAYTGKFLLERFLFKKLQKLSR